MRKPSFFIAVFFFSLLFFSACEEFDELKEIDRVEYEAEYALPLVDTKVRIDQLLEGFDENSTLIVDPDGLLRFKYIGDPISRTSADIFQSINDALPPVIPITGPRTPLPLTTPDGVEIDRMDLNSGQFIYYFENRNNEPVNVTLQLPQVTRNGAPLRFQHTLPGYSGTGNAPFFTNALAPFSMAGYSIVSVNDSIYVEYSAISTGGKELALTNFVIRIQNLGFAYAEGYLGRQLFEGGSDTISIDFFESWTRGDVYFEDPIVRIHFDNAFGIPTRSVVNKFNVITVKGDTLPLVSEFVTNGIDFPYPGLDEVGQVKSSTFEFTRQNSNIDTLLGAGPIAVEYDVDAITNPDGNTDIRGFITENSYYSVQVEVELPLFGKASGFVARDTFDIDFSDYKDAQQVEFKVITDNQLPLDAELQVYFLDDQNAVLDSLLDVRQTLVEGAPVDAGGIALEPRQKTSFIPYPANRFEGIKETKKALVVAAFSTVNQGTVPVKIFSEKELHIRIGAKVGVKGG